MFELLFIGLYSLPYALAQTAETTYTYSFYLALLGLFVLVVLFILFFYFFIKKPKNAWDQTTKQPEKKVATKLPMQRIPPVVRPRMQQRMIPARKPLR